MLILGYIQISISWADPSRGEMLTLHLLRISDLGMERLG